MKSGTDDKMFHQKVTDWTSEKMSDGENRGRRDYVHQSGLKYLLGPILDELIRFWCSASKVKVILARWRPRLMKTISVTSLRVG